MFIITVNDTWETLRAIFKYLHCEETINLQMGMINSLITLWRSWASKNKSNGGNNQTECCYKVRWEIIFSVCLSVHQRRGGAPCSRVPGLWSQSLSWGMVISLVPGSLLQGEGRGILSQVLGQRYALPSPRQVQDRNTLPLARTRMGIHPLPSRTCHEQDTAWVICLLHFHAGWFSCQQQALPVPDNYRPLCSQLWLY